MGVGGTPVTPVSTVGVPFPAGTVADPITVTIGGDTGGDATAANQVIQITAEQAILAKLTSDPATQTTLAAILAKIIAAPATAANQTTEITSLASIDTKVGSATPAGTNIIGKVGIDQTTPGTTNLVATNFGTVFGGADGLTNNNVIYVKGDSGLGYPMNANMVFNGTSWDRLPGTTKGVLTLPGGNSFINITTASTTTAKSGAGVLHTVTVNALGTVASTTTIYDNTAGSGTKIATINTLAGQESYIYDAAFATGLTIVTTGTVAPDITVTYR